MCLFNYRLDTTQIGSTGIKPIAGKYMDKWATGRRRGRVIAAQQLSIDFNLSPSDLL